MVHWEKIPSSGHKEGLFLIKKQILAQLDPTKNSQENAIKFKEYLTTLTTEQASAIETEMERIGKGIQAAKQEFAENFNKRKQAINPMVNNKDSILCEKVVKKLHKLTKTYLASLDKFSKKDLAKKEKISLVVNKLLSILEAKEVNSWSKIESFYSCLEDNSEDIKNIERIKTDKRVFAINFLAGIAVILISLATLPVSIPLIAAIYANTGKHPLDLFKNSGEIFEKEINRLRNKTQLHTLFSSKKDQKEESELEVTKKMGNPPPSHGG